MGEAWPPVIPAPAELESGGQTTNFIAACRFGKVFTNKRGTAIVRPLRPFDTGRNQAPAIRKAEG